MFEFDKTLVARAWHVSSGDEKCMCVLGRDNKFSVLKMGKGPSIHMVFALIDHFGDVLDLKYDHPIDESMKIDAAESRFGINIFVYKPKEELPGVIHRNVRLVMNLDRNFRLSKNITFFAPLIPTVADLMVEELDWLETPILEVREVFEGYRCFDLEESELM